MRTIIIGDIHGCLRELDCLLDKLSLERSDHLISIGDLLDKGPDSPGVVRRLRELREKGFQFTLIQGNHEDKHRRFRSAVSMNPGDRKKFSNWKEMDDINRSLSQADVEFLRTAKTFVKVPGGIALHAGVSPNQRRLCSEREISNMSGRARNEALWILRTRYVRQTTGQPVALDDTRSDDVFWAEIYDGRFGHIYFGHEAFRKESEPKKFKNATGIDLGCVYGNKLCAVILDDTGIIGWETVDSIIGTEDDEESHDE